MTEDDTILTADTNTDPATEDGTMSDEDVTLLDDDQGKKTDDKDSDTDQTKNVPEKYDLVLGEKSQLDPSVLNDVAGLAKELALDNEQAQKVATLIDTAAASHFDHLVSEHKTRITEWVAQVKKDSVMGGANFNGTIDAAKRPLAKYGDDELRAGLKETGFGNHPALIRFLSKIGKAMGEDHVIQQQHATAHEKSIAERLYPELQNKPG